MIKTYSSTIRRKEMEAVLVCMVDERLGPGEACTRLVQYVKECTSCDGAVALRSPSLALEYALAALSSVDGAPIEKGASVMISALAPCWQVLTLEKLGYRPLVLDVCEENGLVTPEVCAEGVRQGGKVLVLTESMGVLPDMDAFAALGVPIIEDISQSALARYPFKGEAAGEGEEQPKGVAAGMCGSYAIFGMEDRDIVTAGGGAVLMAPTRKAWIPLKALADAAPSTDLMPDMNASLAFVEMKEYARNEAVRKELFGLYSRAIMSGRHKTYARAEGDSSTVYSFPLVLNTGFKDVKSYAQKKGIEVRQAYENSVIALRQEALSPSCICANSLLLRCALFPLYPRLGQKDAARIVKVLQSLP